MNFSLTNATSNNFCMFSVGFHHSVYRNRGWTIHILLDWIAIACLWQRSFENISHGGISSFTFPASSWEVELYFPYPWINLSSLTLTLDLTQQKYYQNLLLYLRTKIISISYISQDKYFKTAKILNHKSFKNGYTCHSPSQWMIFYIGNFMRLEAKNIKTKQNTIYWYSWLLWEKLTW